MLSPTLALCDNVIVLNASLVDPVTPKLMPLPLFIKFYPETRRLGIFIKNTTENVQNYKGMTYDIKLLAFIPATASIVNTTVKVHIKENSDPCLREDLWAPDIEDQFISYDQGYIRQLKFPRFRLINPKCDSKYKISLKLIDADTGMAPNSNCLSQPG
jgi:hypothetical protein